MKKIVFLLFTFFCLVSFAQNQETKITEASTYDDSIRTIRFAYVEEVPVHPKCENKASNKEKRDCTSLKIQKHFQYGFDYENVMCTKKKKTDCIPSLAKGQKKIKVQFKIGVTGEIEDIQVKAPHPKLSDEAKRVANRLPKMKPGKHKGKLVNVVYYIPVVFVVQ